MAVTVEGSSPSNSNPIRSKDDEMSDFYEFLSMQRCHVCGHGFTESEWNDRHSFSIDGKDCHASCCPDCKHTVECLPCPACGGLGVTIYEADVDFHATCDTCEISGPNADNKFDAAEFWNKLPRSSWKNIAKALWRKYRAKIKELEEKVAGYEQASDDAWYESNFRMD